MTESTHLNSAVEALLQCYKDGVFPMSDSRDDTSVFVLDPELRGVIPLDGLHISKSLRKFMRKSDWTVRYNADFVSVIELCAELAEDRKDTWISFGLESLYIALHEKGYAYSVAVYEDDKLIGGLYGVSIGAAFFGESMVSRRTNASKVALVGLVKALNQQGYQLLDTQFLTPHLASLGGIEIPRRIYQKHLKQALQSEAKFQTGNIDVRTLI